MTPFWDERVAHWVARHIDGCERGFGNCKALGIEHKGELVAGVVFHNWEPETGVIEVSGAATDTRWMTRKVINAALEYVFEDAGCQMLVARQALTNSPARRLWLGIGGTEHIMMAACLAEGE